MTAGLAVQQVVYDMERTIGHRYTGTKKHNSCSRCQCLLCGAELIAMNHPHAIAHGFKDKYEMIDAEMIKWI